MKRIKHEYTPLIRFAVTCILGFFILNLFAGNITLLEQTFQRLIALSLFLALIFIHISVQHVIEKLRRKKTHNKKKILIGLLLLFTFIFLVLSISNRQIWIFGIPTGLIGIYLLQKKPATPQNEFFLLSLTTLLYGIFIVLYDSFPAVWHATTAVSHFWSQSVGSFVGSSLLVGPSMSGFFIVLYFVFVFLCFLFLYPVSLKRGVIGGISYALILVFWWSLYLVLIEVFSTDISNVLLLVQLVLLFGCAGCFFVLSHWVRNCCDTVSLSEFFPSIKSPYKSIVLILVVLFLFFSTVGVSVFIFEISSDSASSSVLFYTKNMFGDWSIPGYGRYGQEGVGMFGLLPVYLNRSGFSCSLLVENTTDFVKSVSFESENISQKVNLSEYVRFVEGSLSAEVLADVDVVVMMNLNQSVSLFEREVLWDFVASGGSLLVMGDHTNASGILNPLNEVIEPVDISFRFDSALSLQENNEWVPLYLPMHHPSMKQEIRADTTQLGVGASLQLGSGSQPLLVGRYGFSDQGNRSNELFAFLGDYSYHSGELIGDVVLVAGSEYGSGFVSVFGDTSPFQNSALPQTFSFVSHHFSYLTQRQTDTVEGGRVFAAVVMIGLFVLSVLLMKSTPRYLFFISLVLCAALLSAQIVNTSVVSTVLPQQKLAVIDVSHGELFSLDSFTDASLNGLVLNLQRNGYLPVFSDELDSSIYKRASLLLFNAPTRSFSSHEVQHLLQYMKQGGYIMLATGYAEKQASQPLLDAMKLDIQSLPLGPVPYGEDDPDLYEFEPRFVDAYPISFSDASIISFHNFTWDETYHLIVFASYGSGGLVLIGDSQYLTNKNIESIYDYWPGNILLVKHLIEELETREGIR